VGFCCKPSVSKPIECHKGTLHDDVCGFARLLHALMRPAHPQAFFDWLVGIFPPSHLPSWDIPLFN